MKIAKSSGKGWQCLGAEPFLFTLPGPARDPARKYTPRDRKLIIPRQTPVHPPWPNTQTQKERTSNIITLSSHLIHPSIGRAPERPPPISTDNPPTNAPPVNCKLHPVSPSQI